MLPLQRQPSACFVREGKSNLKVRAWRGPACSPLDYSPRRKTNLRDNNNRVFCRQYRSYALRKSHNSPLRAA